MADEKYTIPADPQYRISDIRKLQDTDPASATQTFNPVLEPILESVEHLNRHKAGLDESGKVPAEQLPAMNYIPTSDKGKANGVAQLDATGKVPSTQLPAMNYDTAGAAAAVQQNLNAHTGSKSNPHGVTAQQVGAAPENHTHSAADVGALPAGGTASAAKKLATARTIQTNLGSGAAANFDGTGNATPGVTGVLPAANGGTGNSSGFVTAGKKAGTYLGGSSTCEGYGTTANGFYAHAEGYETTASDEAAHAEGNGTTASGMYAHSAGRGTIASGNSSHAGGRDTVASGLSSFSIGESTIASGDTSSALGFHTIAEYIGEIVGGLGNKKYSPTASNTIQNLLALGNGTLSSDGLSFQTRTNAFRVDYWGKVYCSGNYNTSGADYAEMFEWLDGNPSEEDRAGKFVTLSGSKIRIAGPEDDYILGVVSGNPSVIGDVYDDQWHGIYETDVFGRPVLEYREFNTPAESAALDGTGAPTDDPPLGVVGYFKKPNQDYDGSKTYIPRSERKEWDAVGLLGKLVVCDDGTCQPDGYCQPAENGIATAADTYLPGQTYRVMERVSANVVKIIFR